MLIVNKKSFTSNCMGLLLTIYLNDIPVAPLSITFPNVSTGNAFPCIFDIDVNNVSTIRGFTLFSRSGWSTTAWATSTDGPLYTSVTNMLNILVLFGPLNGVNNAIFWWVSNGIVIVKPP